MFSDTGDTVGDAGDGCNGDVGGVIFLKVVCLLLGAVKLFL